MLPRVVSFYAYKFVYECFVLGANVKLFKDAKENIEDIIKDHWQGTSHDQLLSIRNPGIVTVSTFVSSEVCLFVFSGRLPAEFSGTRTLDNRSLGLSAQWPKMRNCNTYNPFKQIYIHLTVIFHQLVIIFPK